MDQNHQLAHSISPLLIEVGTYRRLVGRSIYLAFTLPDLTYIMRILSQFLQEPRRDHMDAALRVYAMLKVVQDKVNFFTLTVI